MWDNTLYDLQIIFLSLGVLWVDFLYVRKVRDVAYNSNTGVGFLKKKKGKQMDALVND